jgi:hypothetical protein
MNRADALHVADDASAPSTPCLELENVLDQGVEEYTTSRVLLPCNCGLDPITNSAAVIPCIRHGAPIA